MLFLVKQIDPHIGSNDQQLGHVILAGSPARARKLAAERAMDEGKEMWLDPKLTSCKRISLFGPDKVILSDSAAK